ncbi:MAG: sigma factor-like helix-turn-helix DNA-binding protein [Candidatus Dormibacteria bacterium]
MHDSQGWRLEEISALMEIPLPTVKSHLRRGRQALVTALGGLRDEP